MKSNTELPPETIHLTEAEIERLLREKHQIGAHLLNHNNYSETIIFKWGSKVYMGSRFFNDIGLFATEIKEQN